MNKILTTLAFVTALSLSADEQQTQASSPTNTVAQPANANNAQPTSAPVPANTQPVQPAPANANNAQPTPTPVQTNTQPVQPAPANVQPAPLPQNVICAPAPIIVVQPQQPVILAPQCIPAVIITPIPTPRIIYPGYPRHWWRMYDRHHYRGRW